MQQPRLTMLIGLVALAALGPAHGALIDLTGTVRDFRWTGPDAHPDFEYVIADDHAIVTGTLGADKKPVYASAGVTPTTHGAVRFDQWYRDTPGVNLSTPLTITLANSIPTPDIYTYTNGSFFPIDGVLFGNEGLGHNFHFTFELHTQFTYGGGETFAFSGDDDLWVYINNKKVIDLGGIHPTELASVSLDAVAGAIGISTGGTYDLDLFFAERHTSASTFRIDTSIVLETKTDGTVPEPATCVVLLGGLAAVGRRRLRARPAARR